MLTYQTNVYRKINKYLWYITVHTETVGLTVNGSHKRRFRNISSCGDDVILSSARLIYFYSPSVADIVFLVYPLGRFSWIDDGPDVIADNIPFDDFRKFYKLWVVIIVHNCADIKYKTALIYEKISKSSSYIINRDIKVWF